MRYSPLHCIDFYKADHRRQYPPGTSMVVSNLTPRSARYAPKMYWQDRIVLFGVQYFLKDYMAAWDHEFFTKPLSIVRDAYRRRMDTSLGKDSIPLDHIEALHRLGYLPLEIRSLPEGSIVPVGCPCLTIRNTRREFYWLVNYIESVLSAYLWMPCTSATTAMNYRALCDNYAKQTGTDPAFVNFQCHDFSFRGMSSVESAAASGAGHLLYFNGTDTIPAIDFVEQYYGGDCELELIGASVPATEHSVMSMGGAETEIETFERLFNLYPSGIVSIVSDTWDFWKVLTEYAVTLKPQIMARHGKIVFRPDSGDPVKIIAGDPNAPIGTPENKGAVEVLWEIFGGTTTATGHKLLDSHVGLIYGDSITYERAEQILSRLYDKGFASGNIVFGVGSYTYQGVTRDTWGWAVKATYGEINGEPRDIYKSPKTDRGDKVSARGLIVVKRDDAHGFTWKDGASMGDFLNNNAMNAVFVDGVINETNWATVRRTATGAIEK